MSAQCGCNKTLANTGLTSKKSVVNDGNKIVVVQIKADDGTFNEIPEGTTIDQTYIDGLVNNTDPSKKWYPIGDFRNVADTRADPTTESFSDGSSSVTVQGVRSFVGWLLGFPASFIENLEAFKCTSFGIYTIDECGDLVGKKASNGALRPIEVNSGSWYPGSYMKGSDTEQARVTLQFEFSQKEKDSSLRVIPASEMSVDLTELEGLVNVLAAISSITDSGFVAKLTADDGTLSGIDVIGWTDPDFTVFNVTTQLAITITSVTEAPEGTYTFVIPAATSADVLRLTGSKNGFDLPPNDFVIP